MTISRRYRENAMIERIITALNIKVIHEDTLPEDISDELYAKWFALSYIPDGVGCRVGPALEFVRGGHDSGESSLMEPQSKATVVAGGEN